METDLMKSSEEWSRAHLVVHDLLSQILNQLRDLGYNPGYHITYNRTEQHLMLADDILRKHPELKVLYNSYLKAVEERDEALERVQQAPKVDLGF